MTPAQRRTQKDVFLVAPNEFQKYSTSLSEKMAKFLTNPSSGFHEVYKFEVKDGEKIAVDIGARPVSLDGSFPARIGDVQMVHILVEVGTKDSSGRRVPPNQTVNYGTATMLRQLLFPNVSQCYLLEGPHSRQNIPNVSFQWFFVFFVSNKHGDIEAPADFDWAKYRIRHKGLLVSRVGSDGSRMNEEYLNESFPDFYHSYTEGRGTFWELDVSPPPEQMGMTDCFEALSKAISRKGMLGNDIVPVSLEWKHENTIETRYRKFGSSEEHAISCPLPSVADLATAKYRVPGDQMTITSVNQYVAVTLNSLRESIH